MKLANLLDFLYNTHTSHYSAQLYHDFSTNFLSDYVKDYILFSILNHVTGNDPCCSVVAKLGSPVEGDTCNNSKMGNGTLNEVLKPFQGANVDHGC